MNTQREINLVQRDRAVVEIEDHAGENVKRVGRVAPLEITPIHAVSYHWKTIMQRLRNKNPLRSDVAAKDGIARCLLGECEIGGVADDVRHIVVDRRFLKRHANSQNGHHFRVILLQP